MNTTPVLKNLIISTSKQIALTLLFAAFVFAQDSTPTWYKEWANDTIHLKAEDFFWIPNGIQIDEEFIEDIRGYSKPLKNIVEEYSFQEFSFGNIKWVSLVNSAGTTDPFYMIKEKGTWKIVLDRFREKIPFPNEKSKSLMENMFDYLEKQNSIYVKEK